MEFSKVTTPTLKELFVQQIQGKILSGELPVGAPLPTERELAEQMNISRSVVNNGIAELAEKGFLEVRPRQGVVVADYRKTGNLSTLVAMMEYDGNALGDDSVRSVLDIRRALGRMAVEKSIQVASQDEIEELGQIADRLLDTEDPEEAAEIAFEFQHHLAIISQDVILPLFYTSFRKPVIILWIRFCKRYGIESLYNNEITLYNFMEKRDIDGALQWIDTYLGRAISGDQNIYD